MSLDNRALVDSIDNAKTMATIGVIGQISHPDAILKNLNENTVRITQQKMPRNTPGEIVDPQYSQISSDNPIKSNNIARESSVKKRPESYKNILLAIIEKMGPRTLSLLIGLSSFYREGRA